MASTLEIGKLVGASFLYRYWNKLGFFMRTYLLLAIFVLMIITSAGIFGYLSKAYQQDILPLEGMQDRIVLLKEQKIEIQALRSERVARKTQIDTEISTLPNNFVTGRQRLRETYKLELTQLDKDISDYNKKLSEKTSQIHELSGNILEQRVKTGPIIFISETFGYDTDTSIFWLIMAIIFAFDPLAVSLTIGANIAFIDRRKVKTQQKLQPINNIPTTHNNGIIDEHVLDIVNGALAKTSLSSDQRGAIDTLFRRDQINRSVRENKNS